MRDNFEDLKEGDDVLIDHGSWTGAELYAARVIRRTKTRITTECRGREEVWTLDGSHYPRETGYGHRSSLFKVNDENLALLKRHSAVRKIRSALRRLEDLMKGRDKLGSRTQVQLDELAQALSVFTAEPDSDTSDE